MENLPVLAALDRACFETPLPGDDLCDYLIAAEKAVSGGSFLAVAHRTQATPIALLLSIFDSRERLQPTGLLLLVVREEVGLIERIGIHPEHRGKGLARTMLDRVRVEAGHWGARVWCAEVQELDISGQQFYRHLGFLHSCPVSIKQPFEPQDSSTLLMWQ